MRTTCRKHEAGIHQCIEKIINTCKQKMIQVPFKDKPAHIMLNCKQVDDILAYAAEEAYHPKEECALKWEPVMCCHEPDLMCENCGRSFRDRVIERARGSGVL